MDFHCLPRKELQALCKLNKIPANITNVAMADALKSLPTVTGLDDIHENPQFSSPLRAEAELPDLPRTCRRTSARRKPIREDSKDVSASPMPRTSRRTTRETCGKAKVEEEGLLAPEIPRTPANGSKAPVSQPRTRWTTAKRAGNKEEEALPSAAEIPGTPANGLMVSSRMVLRSGTRSVIVSRKEEERCPVEVQETPVGLGGRRTRLSTRKRMEEAMAAVTSTAGKSTKTGGRKTTRGKVGVAKMAALTQEQEQKDQDKPEIKRAEEQPTEEEKAGDKEKGTVCSGVSSGSINPDVVLELEGSSDQLAVEIKETDDGDCIAGQEEERSVEFTLEQSCNLILDGGKGDFEVTLIEGLASLELNPEDNGEGEDDSNEPDSPIKGLISLAQTVEIEVYDQDVRETGLDLDFHQQQKHFSEIGESDDATREPPPTPFDPSLKEGQMVGNEGFDSDCDGRDREPELTSTVDEKDWRVEDNVPKFNQDDDQDDLNDGSAGSLRKEQSKPAGFTTETDDDGVVEGGPSEEDGGLGPDLELQDVSTVDVTDENDDYLSNYGSPQNVDGDLIKNSQESDENLEVASRTVIALPAICNQISITLEALEPDGGDLIKNSLDSDVLVHVPVLEDEEANLDLLTGKVPAEIKEIGDITFPENNSSESGGDESPDLNIASSSVCSLENVLASDAGEFTCSGNVSDPASIDTGSAAEIIPSGIGGVGESKEPYLSGGSAAAASIIPVPVPEESLVWELSQAFVSRSGGGGRGLPEEQGSKKKKKEWEGRKRIDSDKENAGIYSPPSTNKKVLTLLTSVEPIEGKSAKANKQQPNTELQSLSMRKLKKLLLKTKNNNNNMIVTDGGSKLKKLLSEDNNNMIVTDDSSKQVEGKKRSALSTLNENCLASGE